MLNKSKILFVMTVASALSGCSYVEGLWNDKPSAPVATTSAQAAPASIRDQVIAVKADCEKTTQTKPQ
jgi:uncharacterized protein YceK